MDLPLPWPPLCGCPANRALRQNEGLVKHQAQEVSVAALHHIGVVTVLWFRRWELTSSVMSVDRVRLRARLLSSIRALSSLFSDCPRGSLLVWCWWAV